MGDDTGEQRGEGSGDDEAADAAKPPSQEGRPPVDHHAHATEAGHDDQDAAEAVREGDYGDTPGWKREPGRGVGEGVDADPKAGTTWRQRDPLPALLVALTGITGAADAVSYLALGQIFTANMTGNIVLLGFAVAGTEDLSVGGHLVSLGAFVLGALIGGRLLALLEGRPRHHWMLLTAAFNAALILLAALFAVGLTTSDDPLLRDVWPVILFLAVSMGVRNAVVHRLHVADLPVSVVTTTLTGLVSDSALAGHENVRPVRRFAAVLSMFAGALIGGVLVLNLGASWALLVVAFTVPVLCVTYTLHPGRSKEPVGSEPVIG